MPEPKPERPLFVIAVVIVAVVSLSLLFFTEQAEPVISNLYDWIAYNFGVF